jgi:hypothetical protein
MKLRHIVGKVHLLNPENGRRVRQPWSRIFTCEHGECFVPGFGLMLCDATGHSYNYFQKMPPLE